MKRSEKDMKYSVNKIFTTVKRFFDIPSALAIWVVIGLMVPATALCFTESQPFIVALTSFFLPLGVYSIIFALIRKVGLSAFILFPFMVFAAFQLVLLYLYGEGIIAVDMFLNVFTTSFSEATELLSNLIMALVAVVVLYVSALVWGGYAWKRGLRLSSPTAKRFKICGMVWLGIGIGCGCASYLTVPGFNIIRSVFPANVIDNLVEAVNRTGQMRNYRDTSRNFTYNAVSKRDSSEKELYILVIGETGRAHDWQLGGYHRETNPKLAATEGLTYFPHSFSESNTTHKSVPMLMSAASAENFDSIYTYKSIITAFKEAGFHTAFFSVQAPNRSYTQYFANEADTTVYIPGGDLSAAHDGALLQLLRDEIGKSSTKEFIVLHTYGSHFKYSDRYPDSFAIFKPDRCSDASAMNRKKLINAYDNTIIYTDYILSQIIEAAGNAECRSAVLYSTDHGEDIFDDSRRRFLHASPTPTAMQLHVPVICWLSPKCRLDSPEYTNNLQKNRNSIVSPQKSLCMTIMDIAGIDSPLRNDRWSLVSSAYVAPALVYLTDRNEPLPWEKINFKKEDHEYFKKILRCKN